MHGSHMTGVVSVSLTSLSSVLLLCFGKVISGPLYLSLGPRSLMRSTMNFMNAPITKAPAGNVDLFLMSSLVLVVGLAVFSSSPSKHRTVMVVHDNASESGLASSATCMPKSSTTMAAASLQVGASQYALANFRVLGVARYNLVRAPVLEV